MFLINQATKRPQRPSVFLGLSPDEWTGAEMIDFDLAFEVFDMWVEHRKDAKKEAKAKKHREGYTTVPMFPTIQEVLAIGTQGDGFAQNDAERLIAEAINSGVIDLEDLPALLELHGSTENVLRMVIRDGDRE